MTWGRAGASVGSLYHHFGGKADLYLALFEDYQSRQEDRAATAVRDRSDSPGSSERRRLPRTVIPSRYDISMTPDLVSRSFTGSVRVCLAVHEMVDQPEQRGDVHLALRSQGCADGRDDTGQRDGERHSGLLAC